MITSTLVLFLLWLVPSQPRKKILFNATCNSWTDREVPTLGNAALGEKVETFHILGMGKLCGRASNFFFSS